MRAAVLFSLALALPVPASARHPILWIMGGADPAAQQRSERLAIELALTLEAVDVRAGTLPVADFHTRPAAEQIDLACSHLERTGARAMVWLVASNDGDTLYFVATKPGDAFVRTFHVPADDEHLPGVALAVREIATSAYLFAERPLAPRVVEAPPPPPPPAPAKRGPWALGYRNGARAPLQGGKHAALAWLATVLVLRELAPELRVGLSLEGLWHPRQPLDDGHLEGRSAAAGPLVSYDWRLGDISLGAHLGAALAWRDYQVQVGAGPTQGFASLRARLTAGVQVGFQLTAHLALMADASVTTDAPRRGLRRRSNHDELFVEPLVAGAATLGVLWSL